MYKKIATVFSLMIWMVACDQLANHSPSRLEITNAYIVAPVAGRPVTAGYFTLTNSTDSDFSLVSVTVVDDVALSVDSPVSVMMHRTVALPDGMMQMQSVKRLGIKSGEQIAFAPGGYHLMLSGMPADINRLSLKFCDAQQRCIAHSFEVKIDG